MIDSYKIGDMLLITNISMLVASVKDSVHVGEMLQAYSFFTIMHVSILDIPMCQQQFQNVNKLSPTHCKNNPSLIDINMPIFPTL